ncbi:MAG: ribosome silencing factor [Spiribacter sp.]|jgi:ribosome-associated protein|nr:ribosome silencing factor [Spiribacter sp.]MDR9480266.1 ribosome silencing factor [Spiribacter sp.]
MNTIAASPQGLRDYVAEALDDMKAVDPRILDVQGRTAITDYMAFASGNSRRHVRSIAEAVIDKAREAGLKPMGIEGLQGSEWVLVDLGDVVVHVMLEDVREFYRLERIWSFDEAEA